MEETNNANNSKAFWLTLVFVVLLVGVLSFLGINPLNFLSKKEEPKKQVENIETLSIDKDLVLLESKANFPKLEVKSSSSVKVSELPKEVLGLVLVDATFQNANKEVYTNGNGGWNVNYQHADNVMNAYNKVYSAVRDAGFQIDVASRTFSAAIVSGESARYVVKVTAQYVSDNESLIKVFVTENK